MQSVLAMNSSYSNLHGTSFFEVFAEKDPGKTNESQFFEEGYHA